MKLTPKNSIKVLACLAIPWLLGLAGCGALVNIANVIWGNRAPAEYAGLEDKKVAVVCLMKSAPYGRDRTPEMLARLVELTLQKEVKKIKIIRHEEVADWNDHNDWEAVNYHDIGRAVDADRVLAIELSSYSLHDGPTLYQGKADVDVTVYDINDKGRAKFHREMFQYKFPDHGGRPVIEMSERKFEQTFLRMLSQRISNYFYDYELTSVTATDAALLD